MSKVSNVGYSGTPLAKKLGFKPEARVFVHGAPTDYEALLDPLPDGVVFADAADLKVDIVHLFTTRRDELESELGQFRSILRADAAVWISWPKKTSKVPTDITEDTIREVALPLGFVDIKVCAVSEIWSGLKLVVRKELR